MPSAYETILADEVLARLKAAPNIVTDPNQVRRAHRTKIPLLESFSVHLIDGNDAPRKGEVSACPHRDGMFTVTLFGRSDLGPTVLDPLKIEVMRRLNWRTQAYPRGVTIDPGRIVIQTNIADKDAIRVDMNFDLSYPVAGEWSLELPA